LIIVKLTADKVSPYCIVSTSNEKLRRAIYVAFEGACFYSGRPIKFDEMHIDHIKPLAKGGQNCIANYVACCQQINFGKQGRSLGETEAVVQGIVNLIYAPRVVSALKDLLCSTDGMIQINDFLRSKLIQPLTPAGFNFRDKVVKSPLHRINKKRDGKLRGMVFFFEKDLEEMFAGSPRRGNALRSVKQLGSANV
jgi:hypothetical protein